jgi:endonuclease YncB( thermonuclease family)
VTIAGRVEKIERHSGGNAIVHVKDATGTMSVFLEKNRGFDLLRLSVGMACQVTGKVQSYQGRFELAPASDLDLVLPGDDRFETVKVTRVSDGDTITVQGSDGRSRKIRVLGVDSPEMPLNGKPVNFCS